MMESTLDQSTITSANHLEVAIQLTHLLKVSDAEVTKTVTQTTTSDTNPDEIASSMLADAQFLVETSTASSKVTDLWEVNSKIFDVGTFADLLTSKYPRASSKGSCANWELIGSSYGHRMNTAPNYEFMLGSFQPHPPVTKPKKERSRKARDIINPTKVTPTQLDTAEAIAKAEKDHTSIEVEKLYNQLVEWTNANLEGEGLPYLKWVLDKASFTKTIENIFHTMFLIKEGVISIEAKTNEKGVLRFVVFATEPEETNSDSEDESQSKNIQSIFTVDYDMWENWCNQDEL